MSVIPFFQSFYSSFRCAQVLVYHRYTNTCNGELKTLFPSTLIKSIESNKKTKYQPKIFAVKSVTCLHWKKMLHQIRGEDGLAKISIYSFKTYDLYLCYQTSSCKTIYITRKRTTCNILKKEKEKKNLRMFQEDSSN